MTHRIVTLAEGVVAPDPSHRAAFAAMAEDWRRAGEDRYALARDDYDAWLERLHRDRHAPRPDRAPTELLALFAGDRVVAVGRLRLRLTEGSRIEGGHIGYDVPPSERRRGHATRLLAALVDRAAALGIEDVLVTCDTANVASMRVIVKNGGVLDGESPSPDRGVPVSRYWIRRGARTTAPDGALPAP